MSHLLIVEIEKGTLQGVYTNAMEDFEIRVKDTDLHQDDEEEFQRLRALIKKGAVRDIYSEPSSLGEVNEPPAPDSDIYVLIQDSNTASTENGIMKQREYAVFIDGYLTAAAELSKFLYSLRKTGMAEDAEQAQELGRGLQALRRRQNENYERLCDYLNSPALFDTPEQITQ